MPIQILVANMNISGIDYESIKDGEGVRAVIYISGCSHGCIGCHNVETHDVNNGVVFTEDIENEIIGNIATRHFISGITLTGGDPLHENNLEDVLSLIEEIRVSFPEKTIWLYTGYMWEEIFNTPYSRNYICTTATDKNAIYRQQIIRNADVLVDGRYIESQRDITLKWRGSSNQRVIDVQRSLVRGEIILWTE